jgi:hypothetical protein
MVQRRCYSLHEDLPFSKENMQMNWFVASRLSPPLPPKVSLLTASCAKAIETCSVIEPTIPAIRRFTNVTDPMNRAPRVRQLNGRVKVVGKFLEAAGRRFWAKGVTYGTFAPAPDGCMFPSRTQVARDFAMMADVGINTVRLYTVPGISAGTL